MCVSVVIPKSRKGRELQEAIGEKDGEGEGMEKGSGGIRLNIWGGND